jgi:hypothetical protein
LRFAVPSPRGPGRRHPPPPRPTGGVSGVDFVKTGRPDEQAAAFERRLPASAARTCGSGRSQSNTPARRAADECERLEPLIGNDVSAAAAAASAGRCRALRFQRN